MPVIIEDTIRDLAAFRTDGVPVTTCYLDVDGRRFRRHQDVEYELEAVLRDGRSHADGSSSVHADLGRIESFVKAGLDRSRTRGLAIFACSDRDLWEVITLPVPVRSRLIINNVPALGQLESVVQEYDRFGVLLADRQRARIFVFELGELVERSEMLDELPRDYDTRGDRERGEVAPHVEALANQHLRRASDAAFRVFQDLGFEHLTIGGPESTLAVLESMLHPYLQERLCDRIQVAPNASLDDIRRAAMDVETAQERRAEALAVSRLRDAVGSGRRGVAGLDGVLTALNERRVDQLLVSDGFRAPGWACQRCDVLAAVGRECKVCGGDMQNLDDVVVEAIEHAMAHSCKVEVCVDNADLDVLGQVGALLRF